VIALFGPLGLVGLAGLLVEVPALARDRRGEEGAGPDDSGALGDPLGAHNPGLPRMVALPADGAFAIVGYDNDDVRVWRPDGTAVEVAPIEIPPPTVPTHRLRPERVLWVGVSADGRTGATAHDGGFVGLFDPRTGRRGPKVAIDLAGPITGPWTRLEVAPGSRWRRGRTIRAGAGTPRAT
jgi:hypothetical protein